MATTASVFYQSIRVAPPAGDNSTCGRPVRDSLFASTAAYTCLSSTWTPSLTKHATPSPLASVRANVNIR